VKVVIGSRSAERAETTAAELREAAGVGHVAGADNLECANQADVVLVAVPWDGHGALLESLCEALTGKIVIDCVNPLGFDKQGPFALKVDEGSAAQQAETLLPTPASPRPSTTSRQSTSWIPRSRPWTPTFWSSATTARPLTSSGHSPTSSPA
jgi:NADPH-dependent F420 reductase